jgi:hypothetical protein
MKARNDGRVGRTHNRSMRRLIILLLVSIGLFACSPVASPASPSAGTFEATPSFAAASRTASELEVAADDAGLKLVATFDRLEVEAGGTVTVALRIEYTRPTDVALEEPCHQNVMAVDLRAPVEPVGRDWNGITAAFKAYVLSESAGSPMESSIRGPLHTFARARACQLENDGDAPGVPRTTIRAGTAYETALTWTAEIVRGVPAVPGPAPFSIRVRHDFELAGSGLIKADTLEVTGTITVVAGALSAVSAGRAIDATLSDPAFAAWLSKQPQRAWVNVNLFLQPGAVGVKVLPEVPYWDVELFLEPRSWAILYVDAMTGKVLGRTFCNRPCDR